MYHISHVILGTLSVSYDIFDLVRHTGTAVKPNSTVYYNIRLGLFYPVGLQMLLLHDTAHTLGPCVAVMCEKHALMATPNEV